MTRGFRAAQARYDAAEPRDPHAMVTCRGCGGSGCEDAHDEDGPFTVECSGCHGTGEQERGPIEIVVARLVRRRGTPRAASPCPDGCDHGWISTPIHWSPDVLGWVGERVQCGTCRGQGWVPLSIPETVPVRDLRRKVPAPASIEVDDELPF